MGRVALPYLKDSYIAVQLRYLFYCCKSDYQARVNEIEENIYGPRQKHGLNLSNRGLIKLGSWTFFESDYSLKNGQKGYYLHIVLFSNIILCTVSKDLKDMMMTFNDSAFDKYL